MQKSARLLERHELDAVMPHATTSGPSFVVGETVRLAEDIWDDGADHHPAGYFGRRGEEVVIRRIDTGTYPYYVSHRGHTDNSFGVGLTEIEKL